ncbi:MAG TPA: T9SS type A sorting domain-containing protein, partial [bacterium]|nr:T9SS type A sorting domain-containing protein [bacterium]
LKIYNISGQEIETLTNRMHPAGEYKITWQPKNMPSGVYLYKIQAAATRENTGQAKQLFLETKKLIFQK